jgi:hypothetical protein
VDPLRRHLEPSETTLFAQFSCVAKIYSLPSRLGCVTARRGVPGGGAAKGIRMQMRKDTVGFALDTRCRGRPRKVMNGRL